MLFHKITNCKWPAKLGEQMVAMQRDDRGSLRESREGGEENPKIDLSYFWTTWQISSVWVPCFMFSSIFYFKTVVGLSATARDNQERI